MGSAAATEEAQKAAPNNSTKDVSARFLFDIGEFMLRC
jgi:hypothetical protein